MTFLEQISWNMEAGPQYEGPQEFVIPQRAVRLIAFYLPQFHPIPENDEWWGTGFTEWTNVSKALPRFVGHYQPHLPGALGFYDLRLPDILRAQAKLALQYGLYGFCFHYYWFGGRRLLDTPLNILLSHRDIDLPFCINWANESWTRTWDGREKNILIEQKYSEKDDIAFAAALEPIVRDPRYITIDGRPLLMLYRPGLLPDASSTVARWRKGFRSLGLKNPYIVMPQTFGDDDPRIFGMDAAVGFPPHKWWDLPATNSSASLLDAGYSGRILSYEAMAQAAAELNPKEYKLFPGVCPSWDNEARKPRRGVCFAGSTPLIYGRWLAEASRKALQQEAVDERLVFINAWNEWAEGTHLEPDRHYGYAYLNETARVLSNLSIPASNKQDISRPTQSAGVLSGSRITPSSMATRWLRRIAKKSANAAERVATILRSTN